MKKVMYAGAALMIGASVYGFVDYKKTQNKQDFKMMYKESKIADEEPPIEEAKDSKEVVPVVKKETLNNKVTANTKKGTKKVRSNGKMKKKKKIIKAEFFSRGGLDDRYIEPAKKIKKLPVPTDGKKEN